MSQPTAVLSTQRLLPFTPREVFEAFADPERLARWWGPKDFTNTFNTFEFRPGGRWDFIMHAPNGVQYPNESFFREIEPHSRVVIEHVVEPWFRLTVSLEPRDGRTHLSWDQEFESPAVAEKFRPISRTANEQNLDRLEAVLGGEGP